MKRIFLLPLFLVLICVCTNVAEAIPDMRGTVFRTSTWKNTTSGLTSTTLDGANDWGESIFYADEAGTLTSLCTYLVSETGTTSVYKIGWEGVDSSTGEADGTYKTGTGECSCTIATNGLSGWECCTPTGTTCAPTRGEPMAITTKVSSGVDGGNFGVFAFTASGDFNDSIPLVPNNEYAVENTSGTGTAGSGTKSSEAPIYMYKYSGRTFGKPFVGSGTQTYSSDSASDEYGNIYKFDCPSGQTYTTRGIEFYGQTASAAKSITFNLYAGTAASPGAVQHSVTWDADQEHSSAGSNRGFKLLWDETTLVELTCGTEYLLTATVNETSSNFGFRYWDVESNSDFDAYPGGADTYQIHRADGSGAFTEVNTRRMDIDLLIEDITDAVGGSGGGGGTVQVYAGNLTQSEGTAAQRRVPFHLVDATDGVTEEAGLTISGSECLVTKNSGATANCAGSIIEVGNGQYAYEFTQSELDTLGYVGVRISEAAARKTVITGRVSVFDVNSSAPDVNLVSASAGSIENGDFVALGTAQSVTAGTITLAASPVWGTDALVNNAVHIVSATTGFGQTECICSNAGVVATLCNNWEITPTGTITYNLIPHPDCDGVVASVTAPVTVGAVNAAGLSDLFDTNSGTTYGAAVAGSVVKEIADNASSGSGGDFVISSGTAQSVTASPAKMRLAASATYADDTLKDHAAVLILTSSGNTAAVGQVMCIKGNSASNDEVTFTRPYKSVPSGTVTYAVIPAPNCNPANWPKNL